MIELFPLLDTDTMPQQAMKSSANNFVDSLRSKGQMTRESAVALTHLETAVLWAMKATTEVEDDE